VWLEAVPLLAKRIPEISALRRSKIAKMSTCCRTEFKQIPQVNFSPERGVSCARQRTDMGLHGLNHTRTDAVRGSLRALVQLSGRPNLGGGFWLPGFKLQLEDRRSAGLAALYTTTNAVIARASQQPGLTGFFTSYRYNVPQIYLDIDRKKAETLDVPMNSVSQRSRPTSAPAISTTLIF